MSEDTHTNTHTHTNVWEVLNPLMDGNEYYKVQYLGDIIPFESIIRRVISNTPRRASKPLKIAPWYSEENLPGTAVRIRQNIRDFIPNKMFYIYKPPYGSDFYLKEHYALPGIQLKITGADIGKNKEGERLVRLTLLIYEDVITNQTHYRNRSAPPKPWDETRRVIKETLNIAPLMMTVKFKLIRAYRDVEEIMKKERELLKRLEPGPSASRAERSAYEVSVLSSMLRDMEGGRGSGSAGGDKRTKAVLIEACREKKIPYSGKTKAELVALLRNRGL
jgi:hypothetical protein